MYGVRLWHPDDRAALSFDDFEGMTAAIEQRIVDDQKGAQHG